MGEISANKKYIPNATTDFVLTSIFFMEVLLALLAFFFKDPDNHTDLYYFFAFSVLASVAIKSTEWFCKHVMRNFVSAYMLGDAPFNHPLSKTRTLDKFSGSMWQLVIHFSMACWEMYLLWDEPWLSHSHTFFEPQPYDYVPKSSLRIFFVAQIAIWVLTCFSHRFNSGAHAHKDYFVMYLHHLATIGLVTVAYYDNQSRVGATVLLVHDVSDIGIDLLKTMNYLKLEGLSGYYIVEFSYGCSVALWVYFRLYLYPLEIFYKGTFFALNILGGVTDWGTRPLLAVLENMYTRDSYQYKHFSTSAGACNVLLFSLLLMHIWWFALLLRILYRMVTSSKPHEAGDEEYEGGSDNEKED